METLFRNLRLAARQIWRQPGFSLAVIVTLGLAIGANTAIFSFVHALLIRPFRFSDSEQLVEIRSVRGGQDGKLSMREILDIKEQLSIVQDIAAHLELYVPTAQPRLPISTCWRGTGFPTKASLFPRPERRC